MLPTLTVNRSFMSAFIAAEAPCFAMGLVEEQGRPCGLLAMRPEAAIPDDVSDGGFNFGHPLYGGRAFEVIHFGFEFYGFGTYNVLVNPNNPLVQSVLERMIEDEDYFFFALDARGHVTAFRAEIGQDRLSQVKANLARIQGSGTTALQYDLAVSAFAEQPQPPGIMLNWVCWDRLDYLDLRHDRLDLKPS